MWNGWVWPLPPSVSSVCQMAGGLESPDIHQCLAVSCSRSSALTCRLVQQNSRSSVLRLMMPPNETPFPGSQIKTLPIRRGSPIQMWSSPVWRGERGKKHATNFKWFAKFPELCVLYWKNPFWNCLFVSAASRTTEDICNYVTWNRNCPLSPLRVSKILMALLAQLCPGGHL